MKNRLDEVLRERGLTAMDLRFLAHCSPALLVGIRRYNWRPKDEVIKRICRVLNCEPSDIWPSEAVESGTEGRK